MENFANVLKKLCILSEIVRVYGYNMRSFKKNYGSIFEKNLGNLVDVIKKCQKSGKIYGKMLWILKKHWKKFRISWRNNKKILEKV